MSELSSRGVLYRAGRRHHYETPDDDAATGAGLLHPQDDMKPNQGVNKKYINIENRYSTGVVDGFSTRTK